MLALLLAEATLVTELRGEPPVLLLDDVLSELDVDRRARLQRAVRGLGQAIVTTTEAAHLPEPADRVLTVGRRRDPRGRLTRRRAGSGRLAACAASAICSGRCSRPRRVRSSCCPCSASGRPPSAPPIAREAWPVRTTADGTLVVHVTSSLWASELTLMAGPIGEKLAAALGRPAPPLQFRIGPVPQPPAEDPVRPRSARPRRAAAERLAGQVADDELRVAVTAALERALVRSDDRPDSA